jgi:hypothetical protein
MEDLMPNQYNAANFTNVPRVLGKNFEDSQPANKVYTLQGDEAKPSLSTRPTPGSGLFFGTSSSTTRTVGKGAWDAGAGTKKVIDGDEAPAKLNIDPFLDTGV